MKAVKRSYRFGADWSPDGKRRYMAAYYLKRREEFKARAKARYRETREQSAARYQRKRLGVLERLRLQRLRFDGEKMRAAARARYAKDPAGSIARANKRRALLLQAGIGTDRAAVRAFIRHVRAAHSIPCHWCQEEVVPRNRRIDHIVPIARGGSDEIANLCAACRWCNARKGVKLPDEWQERLTV